jgi:predicted RNase H-like HicB family nuclease
MDYSLGGTSMKMFIWADPYSVSYGSTIYTAVAETVEEAREMAKTAPAYAFTEYKEKNTPGPSVKLGEPTRVVDLPCGEWNYWSE